MTLLIALVVFSLIILVHELGHFLAARRVGIEVEEFSIGFGPRLAGLKGVGTKFSLRLIPLGGYVKMLGEEGDDVEEWSDNPASYQNKTPWQRMAVFAAGPAMNFVLALVIFILIFGAIGVPSSAPKIGDVVPGHPAQAAGLKAGDEVVQIDGRAMESWEDILHYIQNSDGSALLFTVRRNGKLMQFEITPHMEEEQPFVGIAQARARLSIPASIKEGFRQTCLMTGAVLKSLVGIVTRKISAEELTGPIGIVHFVGVAAQKGLTSVLYLAALISVNLGLFNLLPIPALDGSKMIFLGVELVRKRPLDPRKEGLVHLVGFALLVSLMLVIMYRDIIRFIL